MSHITAVFSYSYSHSHSYSHSYSGLLGFTPRRGFRLEYENEFEFEYEMAMQRGGRSLR